MKKTMDKAATLQKLQDLAVYSSNNLWPISNKSVSFKTVQRAIENNLRIRPAYYGDRVTMDNTLYIRTILLKLCVPYTLTNDNPRGIVLGNLITFDVKFI